MSGRARRGRVAGLAIASFALLALQGCSSSCGSAAYYTQNREGRLLRVPEDLSEPQRTDTFAIPDAERSAAPVAGGCVSGPPKLSSGVGSAAAPRTQRTGSAASEPPQAGSVVPDSRAGASPQLHVTEGVRDMVAAWADAWARGDFDDYLSFYSENFEPPGNADRDAWRESRRQRMREGALAMVRLDTLEIEPSGEGAVARFAQRFEFAGLVSEVRKRLTLAHEDAGWRIVEESVVENM